MTYKLSRRIALFRGPVVTALVLTVAGCNEADSLRSDATAPDTTIQRTPSVGDPVRKTPTDSAATTGSCLSEAGPLVTLREAQEPFNNRLTAQANTKIDARGATWTDTTSYPVEVGNPSAPGLCWSGGSITGTFPSSTTQSTWHRYIGFFLASPNAVIEDLRVQDYGDGVRVYDNANNWTIRRSHIERAHDDCVENDRLYSGLIDDALFEGCYVFLSERPGTRVRIPVDGRNETVTIQNTLVYLQPMPTVYRGTPPGTGPLFKWSDLGSKLAINNTIFRIDQKPNHGDLNFPPGLGTCGNNTIVWLGEGPYPAPLPSCFTVTNDREVWERAVADWKATHQ